MEAYGRRIYLGWIYIALTWSFAEYIGDGGFMVIHTKDGNVTIFDFRKKAPLVSVKDIILDENGKLHSLLNLDL
jgi:gamma-glutamyltranspeptidase/glutathione hydrolase